MYDIELEVGDVVLVGTDGFFDNVFDEQLATTVTQALEAGKDAEVQLLYHVSPCSCHSCPKVLLKVHVAMFGEGKAAVTNQALAAAAKVLPFIRHAFDRGTYPLSTSCTISRDLFCHIIVIDGSNSQFGSF
eukprot:SM007897S22538  [mRNA]  locus=s7897:166:569:+ [translate_table: standard]